MAVDVDAAVDVDDPPPDMPPLFLPAAELAFISLLDPPAPARVISDPFAGSALAAPPAPPAAFAACVRVELGADPPAFEADTALPPAVVCGPGSLGVEPPHASKVKQAKLMNRCMIEIGVRVGSDALAAPDPRSRE